MKYGFWEELRSRSTSFTEFPLSRVSRICVFIFVESDIGVVGEGDLFSRDHEVDREAGRCGDIGQVSSSPFDNVHYFDNVDYFDAFVNSYKQTYTDPEDARQFLQSRKVKSEES